MMPHEFGLEALKLQHELLAAAEVGLLGLRTAAPGAIGAGARICREVVTAVQAWESVASPRPECLTIRAVGPTRQVKEQIQQPLQHG
jgi:hypothetical protein